MTTSLPTCSGRWLSGSGAHREHEPCDRVGLWEWCDGGWYCDDHRGDGDVEAPWAAEWRAKE